MAKERGWLPSLGHASLGTLEINGSRQVDYPHHWASSRVHCIDWFHLRIIRAQGYRTAGPIHFVGLR